MWLLLLAMKSGPQANVSWSNIEFSTDCFFFSGPQNLGRDDTLGVRAKVAVKGKRSIDFGNVHFEGPLSGTRVKRTSTHDFGGPWTVEESFDGTWGTRAFNGHYLYQEQQSDEASPGFCTIRADVVIRF